MTDDEAEEMEAYYRDLMDAKDARIRELEDGLRGLRRDLVLDGGEGSALEHNITRLLDSEAGSL